MDIHAAGSRLLATSLARRSMQHTGHGHEGICSQYAYFNASTHGQCAHFERAMQYAVNCTEERGQHSDGPVHGSQAVCADECWNGAGLAPSEYDTSMEVCDDEPVHLGPGAFTNYPLEDDPPLYAQQPFISTSCPGEYWYIHHWLQWCE